MPKYLVRIKKTAKKRLDALQDNIAQPLLHAIAQLANNPRPHGYKKLKGYAAYRIRVGDYRIIYEIVDNILVVEVITIGHRKDMYC